MRVGRAAIGVAPRVCELTFDGASGVEIPPGQSRWSDPVELVIARGDDVLVDIHLPDPTPYATAAGFRFDRSVPGDHVGALPFPLEGAAAQAVDETREFPAANTGAEPEPDGTGWSLPAGGPLLRTVEVAGIAAEAVVVALGSSSTAMGWPQDAASLLAPLTRIAIVNRGISGNRILRDAPAGTPSWGRAGLSRFDEDVLGTAGATHVVIAYNSNDWGLPGRVTPIEEMPTLEQVIGGYRELIRRAAAAGLGVILATITPLAPELRVDDDREGLRAGLNGWIRDSGAVFADFDAALRSALDPARLDPRYAAPDDTHPNVNGERLLARAFVDVLAAAVSA